MFINENNTIYQVLPNMTICIGDYQKVCHEITGTTQIYKWQIFDLNAGCYVDDLTNNSVITVDGVEYTPVNGVVEMSYTPPTPIEYKQAPECQSEMADINESVTAIAETVLGG